MKNLYQKICDVMKEVESVEKGVTIKINDYSKYKAVGHDDVTRLLHLPCANIGIVLSPSVIESKIEILEKQKEYQGKVTVTKEYMASVVVELTAINADDPQESLSVRMPAIAFDNGDKVYGKAISMATKYAYLKLFMLESIDEEEARPDAEYKDKRYESKPQQTNKPSNQKPQDAAQKAKEELERIKANKAAQDKKDDKELKQRIDSEIKDEIKAMLATLTSGMTMKDKIKYMTDNIAVSSWGEIEKMKNDDLLKTEAKLLTIFKTR